MPLLEPLSAEAEAESFQFDITRFNTKDDLSKVAVVVQDIKKADSSLKEVSLPSYWDNNESLYMFQVPQRYWEGTQVPRASLGVPLVLEHVNAISPQVMDVLFEEDEPFSAIPHPATDPVAAVAANAVLKWELDKACAEEEVEAGVHEALLDGTGVWKSYWHKKNGYMCPTLEWIERRHVYVDPACRKPDIRKARWKAHRMIMTAREIDKLRGQAGYEKIPPLDELLKLGVEPKEVAPQSEQENTAGGMSIGPYTGVLSGQEREQPTSIDPGNHPLEVIEYCNSHSIWTVLQRKILIRDVPNEKYDKVRYFSAFFIRVKGQFDGLGVAALIGGEQRLQQGIINGTLDHLSMTINGMFARVKGTSVFAQNVRVSPGKVIDVDAQGDISPIEMPRLDPAILNMPDISDGRAARRTGANEVAIQGAFPQTSGGIGRTAFGMNMLAQGASARIRKFVKVIEKQVLIPFLEFCIETNPKYLSEALLQEILSPELMESYQLTYDAVMAAGANLKFEVIGATKMKRRAAMIQSVPQLLTFFQQPEVLENLESQFKKLDYDKLLWMMFDATGWPIKEHLIQDMTEDEQMQVISKNEMVQNMAELRLKTQIEKEAKLELIKAEHEGRAGRDVIKSSLEDAKLRGEQQQQLEQQLQYAAGQEAANRELEAEMSQAGIPPGAGMMEQ